jgi:hypothetical protein
MAVLPGALGPARAPLLAADWLPLQPLIRDAASWQYRRWDSGHLFPVSVTGVVQKVSKGEEALRWIEAYRDQWEPRGNTCHAALQHYALQRWGAPAEHWPPQLPLGSAPDPTAPVYGSYREWIEPLFSLPLWAHVVVVASELMLADTAMNVAGTPDLILRFPDGSYGVGDLKTLSVKGRRYATRAQHGGYLALAGRTFGLQLSRCLTFWASPGGCHVTTYTAAECERAWAETFAAYRHCWRPF